MFPEAGCFQHEILGGRYDRGTDRETKGRLKWGVGKLIAHAPTSPIVIAFYHAGMEHIMPQTDINYVRKLVHKYPQSGHDVDLRVGREIRFDDLIEAHEAEFGSLWKYRLKRAEEDEAEFHAMWDSQGTDYILYHKITSRIEQELLELGSSMPYYGKEENKEAAGEDEAGGCGAAAVRRSVASVSF